MLSKNIFSAILRNLFFSVMGSLILLLPATAQTWWRSVGKRVPATLITRKNERLTGQIRILNQYDAQKQVHFFDSAGMQKKLVPFEVLGLYFKPENADSVHYVRVQYLGEYVLVQRDIKGIVCLLSYYHPQPDVENPVRVNYTQLQRRYLVQRGDLTPVALDDRRFYERGAEFFKDYEKLADDIWAKKYKSSQIPEIVKAYNAWYEQQKH
jgi:hypothetical protein